jgi:hypothetical protein
VSSPESVAIPTDAASGAHVVLAIDLAQANSSVGLPGTEEYIPINNQVSFKVVPSLVQDDINNGGTVFMLDLGTLTSSGGKWSFAYNAVTYRGTLVPIKNGGTGLQANPSMLINLASGAADTVLKPTPCPGVYGTLSVANGGTSITSDPSLQVNLASDAADNVFKAYPRPGVYGTLDIPNGGTSMTTNPSMVINLASAAADNVFKASPRPGVTGVLPMSQGGSGGNVASGVPGMEWRMSLSGIPGFDSQNIQGARWGAIAEIYVALAVNATAVNTTTNLEVGTLPADYRPKRTRYIAGLANNTICMFRINTNGLIEYLAATAAIPARTSVAFSDTYFVK